MLVNAETLTVGLSVRLEAKPGRETDLEALLRGAASLVETEPATLVWFAVRLGPTTFGIFDAFADEAGRQAHLAGRIAAALGEHGTALLAAPPAIERIDVLAARLP
jgi:quinol monooxygenase YgiN